MTREPRSRDTGCQEEGALVAFLDDALPVVQADELEAHLARCGHCRDRMQSIEARSEAVGQWIRRHDPPPPSPETYASLTRAGGRGNRGVRWVGAAAVVLLAGALAVPVVGWFVDRVQRITDEAPAVREAPKVAPAQTISFVSPLGELEVRFAAPPTRGTLVLERASDSLVTLEVPGSQVALTVAPGRVDIDNLAAPDGLYRLHAPVGLARARILVPGTLPVVVDLNDEAALPFRVDLGVEARGFPEP